MEYDPSTLSEGTIEASTWALAAGSAQASPVVGSVNIVTSGSPTGSYRRRPSSDSSSSRISGESIMGWNFDALEYTSHTRGKPLSCMARELFRINEGFFNGSYTSTSRDIVAALGIAEKEYNTYDGKVYQVAFHTKSHGADVMQAFHYFLRCTPGLLDAITPSLPEAVSPQLVLIAALFAAASHDLGHFGLDKDFLKKTQHPLSWISENQSVLESYHAASALELLRRSNLVEGTMTGADFKFFKQLVVELILATDLARHFDMMASPPALSDYMGTLRIAIHCADVSNVARPLSVSQKWTDLVMHEFFAQGDLEREKGLPVTPIMDRTSANTARVQLGFIDVITRPLFLSLGSHLDVDECIVNLEEVARYWQDQI